ncbi:MAG: penicillin acylase family protein, partial [Desulfobacteraceae bacterium]
IDNAALLQGLQAKFGPAEGFGLFEDLRWLNDPDAPTMIPQRKTYKKQSYSFNRAVPFRRHDLQKAVQQIHAGKRTRENVLKKININLNKMGSYAWVVSGKKTASGHPILYSGPEMGFSAPAIVSEGSIETPDFAVSGMNFAGVPAIAIGRTPYFAWSMQVGQGHTVDYYAENPSAVFLHRIETIKVAGSEDITIPIYRTAHGPVVYPLPYDPENPGDVILSWKYAHWGLQEFSFLRSNLEMSKAKNIKQFVQAVDRIPMSMHFCFAHRDGSIGYIMSGKDPVRPAGVETRLPLLGDGTQEWLVNQYKPRPFDLNPRQGFYGGWNNKAAADYDTNNALSLYQYGVFHRAHAVQDYLKARHNLTFEELRDLALNIATTDSPGEGGNPWKYAGPYFTMAVLGDPSPERLRALYLLSKWDGHFPAGGPAQWAFGTVRHDAWVLVDRWVDKVMEATFADELLFVDPTTGEVLKTWRDEYPNILFNVLLHALAGGSSGVVNQHDWFQDTAGTGKPSTASGIIVAALDAVLAELGPRPWNAPRGEISYNHDLLGALWTMPFSWRSTYGQAVEMGPRGPERIQSMFPLGQSGNILFGGLGPAGNPVPLFDPNYFSMIEVFDSFAHRDFPLFKIGQ